MAAAAERHYLDALALAPARLIGIATTRHGHGVPTRRIKVIEAGHPVPDEAGLKAADDTLRLAAEADCGRSAAGAAVRRRLGELDRAGRGRFVRAEAAGDARAVALGRADRRGQHRSQAFVADQGRPAGARRQPRAEIVTLAISDVPHDDPSAIASGPTVPDPTTLADARAIVAKYDLAIDDAVRRALDDPRNESCKPGDPAFARAQFELIARPKASLDAAIKIASDAGYDVDRSRRRSRRRGARCRRRLTRNWR